MSALCGAAAVIVIHFIWKQCALKAGFRKQSSLRTSVHYDLHLLICLKDGLLFICSEGTLTWYFITVF